MNKTFYKKSLTNSITTVLQADSGMVLDASEYFTMKVVCRIKKILDSFSFYAILIIGGE
jgi:hypothetical protein